MSRLVIQNKDVYREVLNALASNSCAASTKAPKRASQAPPSAVARPSTSQRSSGTARGASHAGPPQQTGSRLPAALLRAIAGRWKSSTCSDPLCIDSSAHIVSCKHHHDMSARDLNTLAPSAVSLRVTSTQGKQAQGTSCAAESAGFGPTEDQVLL